MSIKLGRSFRVVFASLSTLLASSVLLAQSVPSQTPAETDLIQQANTTLTAAVESNSSTANTRRALVVARHQRLIDLFLANPELARTYALSAKTRAALLKSDPSLAPLIEQDTPLTGQLVSRVADDFVRRTSTTEYSLHTMKGDRRLTFTSIRPDIDRLVSQSVTVTGLSIPEIVAAESLRQSTPAEDQAAAAIAAPQALSVAPAVMPAFSSPVAGPGVAPGSATLLESPLGQQTTAVLILKFAGNTATFPTGFDQPSFYNQMYNGPATPNIAAFMKEGSYGQTTVAADIYGPITVPGSYDCKTTDGMATAAIAAAAGIVDFTKYNHIEFAFPTASCYFGGLGSSSPMQATAAIPHQYTQIWAPITTDSTLSEFLINFEWLAINHEFGHNLGLNHANSLDFGALSLGPLDYSATAPGVVKPGGHAPEAAAAPAQPVSVPFLNAAAAAAAPLPTGSTKISAINTEYGELFSNMGNGQATFSSEHHVQELGWIPASSNQDVTTSGSFTIFPDEVSTGLRTLHILRDPTSSSWIWVEFHQPLGVYTPLAFTRDPYNVANNVLSGAQLHYQDGFYDFYHTLLMDMTPTASPNNFFDSNLTPGNSWSDPFSLLTITTGTQSANSLGMMVSYDTPCATVALDTSTIPAGGGTGTVTLTAPASCNWSVSSNASWISFPGATTGTGNGTVSFQSAANTGVPQRNSYITAQRQSLPIVQPGTAPTLLNRVPATVAVGAFVPITFKFVDALGAADLKTLYMTVRGGTQPDCSFSANAYDAMSMDLYLKTNGVNSSYLTTGTAGTLSNPSCTIDGPSSSYTSSGNTGTLTVMVAFPANFVGTHDVSASAYGSQSGTTIPLSYVAVTAAGVTPSSVAISPSSASLPLTGSPDAIVPFTITGTNTNFTASSTVQVGGTGVSPSNLTFVSATQLTGSLTITSTAALGALPVTVSTGSDDQATVFTVAAHHAPAAYVTATPGSGNQGQKIFMTFKGQGTNFDDSTTITMPTTDIKVTDLFVSAGDTLSAKFDISSTAALGPRVFTITYGGATVQGTFDVTANPLTTTTITAASASILEGASTTLTITVAPAIGTGTPTGYVSFVEKKDGAGLEDILATLPLTNGSATYLFSSIDVGDHTFKAQYLGDATFTESKSTVDAKVAVKADEGTVILAETASLQMLPDGSYEATISIANSGTGTAKSIQLTSATLGGVAPTEPFPFISDIAPGGAVSAIVDFPASVGSAGSASVLKFAGTYTGGNFTGSSRVTLPSQ